MARIAYSLSGEGRGHATRVRTVVEGLRRRHQVTILTSGPAFDLLGPIYDGTDVALGSIEVPFAAYRDDGSLSLAGTALRGLGYLSRLPRVVDGLARFLEECRFDLVITDFEPALPRAADRVGLPVVSLDHHHVMLALGEGEIPGWLQRSTKWVRRLVGQYVPHAELRIVSSFFRPGGTSEGSDLQIVGPLLGPEVLAASATEGEHLLVHLRRHCDTRLLAAVRLLGIPALVYGLGARPPQGNLRFAPTGVTGFVRDLASCRALITTGGSQVVGDAVHLRKPILAVPEPGHREQELDAWFLEHLGAGRSARREDVTPALLRRFLDEVAPSSPDLPGLVPAGNQRVRALLGGVLERLEAARFDLAGAR